MLATISPSKPDISTLTMSSHFRFVSSILPVLIVFLKMPNKSYPVKDRSSHYKKGALISHVGVGGL